MAQGSSNRTANVLKSSDGGRHTSGLASVSCSGSRLKALPEESFLRGYRDVQKGGSDMRESLKDWEVITEKIPQISENHTSLSGQEQSPTNASDPSVRVGVHPLPQKKPLTHAEKDSNASELAA